MPSPKKSLWIGRWTKRIPRPEPKESDNGIESEMVKKTGTQISREGAQVPSCSHCGKRPWTDWRPQFQKYLCSPVLQGGTDARCLPRSPREALIIPCSDTLCVLHSASLLFTQSILVVIQSQRELIPYRTNRCLTLRANTPPILPPTFLPA